MRWSVGVRMLAAADDEVPPKKQLDAPLVQSPPAVVTEPGDPFDDEERTRKARIASEPSSATLASSGSLTPPKANGSTLRQASRRSTRPLPSFPNTPAHSQYGDEDDDDDEGDADADESREDAEWGDLPGGARNSTAPSGGGTRGRIVRGWRKSRSWFVRRVGRPLRKALLVIREFMTVPLCVGLPKLR